MSQEQLILQTLLGIKEDIGKLGEKIEGQVSGNVKRDERLDSHSKRIGALQTYQTTQKARTGVIAAMSAGIVSVLGWVIKITIGTHS